MVGALIVRAFGLRVDKLNTFAIYTNGVVKLILCVFFMNANG